MYQYYTTVIFDLGNVIVLFDANIIARKLAETYDLEENFIYQRKTALENISDQFDNGKISPETFTKEISLILNKTLEISEFKRIWSEIFTENVQITKVVRELKGKARLLVLSNTNTWHFEYISENFDFIDLFDDLILSFRLGYGKPDRRIFERAIELSKASQQILYFDDMAEYVIEARKLGICAHQYTDGNQLQGILRDKGLV